MNSLRGGAGPPLPGSRRYFVNRFLKTATKRRDLIRRFLESINEPKYEGFTDQESTEINLFLDEVYDFCVEEFPKP